MFLGKAGFRACVCVHMRVPPVVYLSTPCV